MALYTRKGDDGKTGLGSGKRVPKSSRRVEAYGQVDELNALVGWVLTVIGEEGVRRALDGVQGDLFSIGALLADPGAGKKAKGKPKAQIDDATVRRIEKAIDKAEKETGPLKTFILPGGSPAAAALHLARTVCRRVERRVVELAAKESVPPAVLRYLNRLSDLFFALARLANLRAGVSDSPW
jgi:cob(I)alamin adenosyltransferase